ncbi:MAG: ATP-dependent 6-phosphofructokinase [Verrucomicrobiota bacterium]
MMERIGILTGGGDCPGLNAVIRAVVKSASKRGWETIGFLEGYEGLLDPVRYKTLHYKEMDGLLHVGGTILGTTNRGRFAAKTGLGEQREIPAAILSEAKHTFAQLALRALVCVGGDGSLTIAQRLFEHGLPVVGVPKTIDNDLEATVSTFGFDSAVACATDALDRLRTTAESHNRVMVLEVMGRYTGWIAAHSGIAGGGDVVLIPEIPFRFDSICSKINEREREGKCFTLVVVAEGARQVGGDFVTAGPGALDRETRLGGVGVMVAAEIQKRTGKETRLCVLGHLQRGGGPTTSDRLLCTRFGARGAIDRRQPIRVYGVLATP